MAQLTSWGLLGGSVVTLVVAVAVLFYRLGDLCLSAYDATVRWWRVRILGRSPLEELLRIWELTDSRQNGWRYRLRQAYDRLTRLLRQAGLPRSPAVALALLFGSVALAAAAAIWTAHYFRDFWIPVLLVVVMLQLPASVLDLLAAHRRQRVEAQIGVAALSLASDLLRGCNPLQAIERVGPQLPEPISGVLGEVASLIRAGGYHRDDELLHDVGKRLNDALDSRRAQFFTILLTKAWDQPKQAAGQLLTYSGEVTTGSSIRAQSTAQVASYRFWSWSMLGGSLLAFVGIPLLIPEARDYMRSPEGVSGVQWWLASLTISLAASRLAGRLPGG